VTPDLVRLLQDPARVADIPATEARRLVVPVSTLAAALAARAAMSEDDNPGQPEAPAEKERLLTIPNVAALLSVPKGYVYELARRGAIPTVRFGKYVRIAASALREWVARHQEKGLDKALYDSYSSSKGRDDRLRTPAHPKAARAHPGSPGRSARRLAQHGGTMGARRDADSRSNGPAHPAAGQDGAEKKT